MKRNIKYYTYKKLRDRHYREENIRMNEILWSSYSSPIVFYYSYIIWKQYYITSYLHIFENNKLNLKCLKNHFKSLP